MAKVSVDDAGSRLSELIDQAGTEAVFVERDGTTAAVLVSPEHYRRLVDAAGEAGAAEGASVRLEQVKTDLGWT